MIPLAIQVQELLWCALNTLALYTPVLFTEKMGGIVSDSLTLVSTMYRVSVS